MLQGEPIPTWPNHARWSRCPVIIYQHIYCCDNVTLCNPPPSCSLCSLYSRLCSILYFLFIMFSPFLWSLAGRYSCTLLEIDVKKQRLRSVEAAGKVTGPSYRAMCVMGWYGNHIMLAGGYTTLEPSEISYQGEWNIPSSLSFIGIRSPVRWPPTQAYTLSLALVLVYSTQAFVWQATNGYALYSPMTMTTPPLPLRQLLHPTLTPTPIPPLLLPLRMKQSLMTPPTPSPNPPPPPPPLQ